MRAPEDLLHSLGATAPRPERTTPPSVAKPSAADEHAWEFTLDAGTRAAFEKYLARFPQGYYAAEARERLEAFEADDTAWEFASEAGTERAIRKYLDKYPEGLHAAEARALLDPFHELMVPVKGGTFEMGDVFGEGESWEKPVHKVTVRDFYLCKYPVTQGQWQAIMGNNPSHFKGNDKLPVENVSWEDAQAFIKKLNEKTGLNYRLPTEAEWEYAAREGGKKVRFGNGKDIADPAEMNFKASEKDDYSKTGEYRQKTTPVDQFPPNALGLHDMSGNVWEWCEDDWHNDYKGAPADGSAWIDQPRGTARVLRGGGWFITARFCRVAFRGGGGPGGRDGTLGFRLVLAPQADGTSTPAFL